MSTLDFDHAFYNTLKDNAQFVHLVNKTQKLHIFVKWYML
jgi:hypothetical protein